MRKLLPWVLGVAVAIPIAGTRQRHRAPRSPRTPALQLFALAGSLRRVAPDARGQPPPAVRIGVWGGHSMPATWTRRSTARTGTPSGTSTRRCSSRSRMPGKNSRPHDRRWSSSWATKKVSLHQPAGQIREPASGGGRLRRHRRARRPIVRQRRPAPALGSFTPGSAYLRRPRRRALHHATRTVSVDGDPRASIRKIRGPEGTTVTLGVESPGEDVREVVVERRRIDPTVSPISNDAAARTARSATCACPRWRARTRLDGVAAIPGGSSRTRSLDRAHPRCPLGQAWVAWARPRASSPTCWMARPEPSLTRPIRPPWCCPRATCCVSFKDLPLRGAPWTGTAWASWSAWPRSCSRRTAPSSSGQQTVGRNARDPGDPLRTMARCSRS